MNTLYFHPRIVSNNEKKKKKELRRNKIRRATIAGIMEPTDDGFQLRIGVSVCSAKDQFVKKYGRAAAEGHAKSKTSTRIPLTAELEKVTEFFVQKSIGLLAELGYEVLPKEKKEDNEPEAIVAPV